ncbi:uncharacterized protein JN550_007936 [Neoarthrinium moseri]|uniref:uncharacterized protein n=1 Tax=Neoarthrinium moseri TaxID=1658444 RepID=UPI001FDB518B|nr:uncharacterized protein JN550_007936 [Neoarthrinium moseri]KAI1865958.1 hypothetical protein JN550_007936 [Neoarthrinium moseri]
MVCYAPPALHHALPAAGLATKTKLACLAATEGIATNSQSPKASRATGGEKLYTPASRVRSAHEFDKELRR